VICFDYRVAINARKASGLDAGSPMSKLRFCWASKRFKKKGETVKSNVLSLLIPWDILVFSRMKWDRMNSKEIADGMFVDVF